MSASFHQLPYHTLRRSAKKGPNRTAKIPYSRHRATPSPRARRRQPNSSPDVGILNSIAQSFAAAMIGPLSQHSQSLQQGRAPPRPPNSAAPDKCELEMSVGDFKAWRCSAQWWIELNRLPHVEAVGHLRLLCSSKLQKAMDAKYDVATWGSLTTEQVLDAIRDIV